MYTKHNCETECLANYTLEMCDCVKFHMPHEHGTAVCGAKKMSCYQEAMDKYLWSSAERNLVKKSGGSLHCDCLPSCESIHYNAEISQADMNYNKYFSTLNEATYKDKG